jgi:DNA repair protein RadA
MPEAPKRIEDIISELADAKERKLIEFWKQAKDKKIEPVDPFKALAREQGQTKLKTGTLIDDMIGGGLETGSSMLLYGEFGSGKSETCFTMAVLCPDIVIYIDTEGSFKWSRIQEMCEKRGLDYKEVFKKIKLFQPANWIEQMMLLTQLPSPAEEGKIGLIIIDSLTKLFRGLEFAGRQELQVKQPQIREQMITLTEIAKAYECAIIFTTQIYESPNANAFLPDWATQEAVGGASLKHQASYVMFLRRAQGNVRIARLVDADWQPLAEKPYQITVKGIDVLQDTETAKKVLEKASEYEKNQTDPLRDKKERLKKGKKEDKTTEDQPVEGQNDQPTMEESTENKGETAPTVL